MNRFTTWLPQWGYSVVGAVATTVLLPWMAAGVEIVAHRGASHDAPENTLPAIRLAWERGADAVEIDIHQTRDGRIVAIHDRTTDRVSGQSGLVVDFPLAVLRQLDVGAWKGARWKDTRIPTLTEVLATVPSGRTLVVEIKCPRTVLPELESVLGDEPNGDQVTLIAFDYETIAESKRRMPDRPAYWLYGFSDGEAERYGIRSPEQIAAKVRDAGLDGLDLRHDGGWVERLTRLMEEVGKSVYVYTVNDPAAGRRLRDLGVAGITTDRPGFLREAMSSQ